MMKKIAFLKLTIFLLLFNTNTFAQEFRIGLVGGLDIANTPITNKQNWHGEVFHPKPSFNANIYLGYKSGSFWGLSFEPGFIQKGRIEKYYSGDDERIRLNYWQIPILADFYLGEKFFISVGPEFTSLINVRAKREDSSGSYISDRYDSYDNDLSGIFGVNFKINNNLDIGLKYSHSLKYVVKSAVWVDGPGGPGYTYKIYNQYFQVFIRFTQIARFYNRATVNETRNN